MIEIFKKLDIWSFGSPLSRPSPSCLSDSVAVTTKQTHLRTTVLSVSSLPPTETCSLSLPVLCLLSSVQRWTNAQAGLGSLVDMRPQGLVESLEGGSVGDVAAPATHHQLEEWRRAERRAVQEDLQEIREWRAGKTIYHKLSSVFLPVRIEFFLATVGLLWFQK